MKVGFLTSTRADYGKLKPLMTSAAGAGCDVICYVLGMHLLERFGSTHIEVGQGLPVDVVRGEAIESSDHLKILSHTVEEAKRLLVRKPDLLVVHGDRMEPLAAAIAARYLGIQTVHLEAGEQSGTFDNIYRDAISTFSHHHLVCSTNALNRLRRLGYTATLIGSPELDEHLNPGASYEDCLERYDLFESGHFGIVLLHPDTENPAYDRAWAELIRDALDRSNLQWLIVGSNNDPNYEIIEENLHGHFFNHKSIHVRSSIRSEHFAAALRQCSIVVGNSSLGVREAPFLGVPSINVGLRQFGRHRSNSIIDIQNICDVHELTRLIEQHWGKRFESDTTFGDGHAAERFSDWLKHTLRLISGGT